jgi:hypothetical protein
MAHPKGRQFGPVEQCIYCGATNVTLTDEHLMPSALGGDLVLVRASCISCQKEINEKVENVVLDWFRNIRYVRKMGFRRLKKRPKTLPLAVNYRPLWKTIATPNQVRGVNQGERQIREVPYALHPAFATLPAFKPPGLIRGISVEQSSKDFLAGWQWCHMEKIIYDPSWQSKRAGY